MSSPTGNTIEVEFSKVEEQHKQMFEAFIRVEKEHSEMSDAFSKVEGQHIEMQDQLREIKEMLKNISNRLPSDN